MVCNTASAALGSSQKLGVSVKLWSLWISSRLVSMSKMPPQGSSSIPQILNIFFGHWTNIRLMMSLFLEQQKQLMV